jgi:predicted nucleic acid-binding protein
VILDASIGVEIALGTDAGRRAIPQLPDEVFVPELFITEVHRVLRRLRARKEITDGMVAAAREFIASPAMIVLPVHHLEDDLWKLSAAVSAYDAQYLVLARTTGTALMTRDKRLASHSNLGVRVLLAD